MKKTVIAIIAALLTLSAILTGCNGSKGGKVTDTSHTDKMLTELSEKLSDAFDMSDTTNGIMP